MICELNANSNANAGLHRNANRPIDKLAELAQRDKQIQLDANRKLEAGVETLMLPSRQQQLRFATTLSFMAAATAASNASCQCGLYCMFVRSQLDQHPPLTGDDSAHARTRSAAYFRYLVRNQQEIARWIRCNSSPALPARNPSALRSPTNSPN